MEDIGDYMSSTIVRYGGGRNTRYLLPAVGLGFSIAMTFLQRLTPRQP